MKKGRRIFHRQYSYLSGDVGKACAIAFSVNGADKPRLNATSGITVILLSTYKCTKNPPANGQNKYGSQ